MITKTIIITLHIQAHSEYQMQVLKEEIAHALYTVKAKGEGADEETKVEFGKIQEL